MEKCDPNVGMPLGCVEKFEGVEHRLTTIEERTKVICKKLDEIKANTRRWELRAWDIAKGVVLLVVGWVLAKMGDWL